MHALTRIVTRDKPGSFQWILDHAVSQAEAEVVRLTNLYRNSRASSVYQIEDDYTQLEHAHALVGYWREARAKAEVAIGETEEYVSANLSCDISEMEVDNGTEA